MGIIGNPLRDGTDRMKSHSLTQRTGDNSPSLHPPTFNGWGLRIKLIRDRLTREKSFNDTHTHRNSPRKCGLKRQPEFRGLYII